MVVDCTLSSLLLKLVGEAIAHRIGVGGGPLELYIEGLKYNTSSNFCRDV